MSIAPCKIDGLVQAVVEKPTVRQTGKVVVSREVPDALLELLALGDVPDDADRVPFPVYAHAGDGVLGDDPGPIFAESGKFEGLADGMPQSALLMEMDTFFEFGAVRFRDNQFVETFSSR